MDKKSEPATKDDVEQIVDRVVKKVVTEVVGKVANEILSVMAQRFEGVDSRLDSMESRLDSIDGRLNRVENILRPTVDQVDDHAVRLVLLEAKTA